MQASGFLDQKQRHPFALGAALAINLAAVGALMVAKGPTLPLPPEIITLINPTPDRPPPEPIETPPQPRDLPKQRETMTVPRPEVPTTPRTDFVFPPLPRDPVEGPVGAGKPIDIVAPTPLPVLTDAALDTRFADDFQPPYPPGKQRLGDEGKAVLRVLIGADGRVKRVERVSGDDAFLSVSERQALRRWRFKPATRDGVPVETWKTMTVRFEIS